MQSISRTQEVKESAELYERIFEVEGMPAEFPNDERVSFAALDEVVAAGPEEIDGDAAEEGAPRLRAAYYLSFADRAVVQRIKAAGWATTPEEIHAHGPVRGPGRTPSRSHRLLPGARRPPAARAPHHLRPGRLRQKGRG